MKLNNKSGVTQELVLLMDDEPQYLDWLVEYIKTKGYGVEMASNLGAGIEKLKTGKYRTIIADLSVPIPLEMIDLVGVEGKAYLDFPGLYLAHSARNMGYRSRQVVVYSVHDTTVVSDVATRIGVCYITKGRPKMLKTELDSILSYDPTA